MNMNIKVTQHAFARWKERISITDNNVDIYNKAQRAWRVGSKPVRFVGEFFSYISSKVKLGNSYSVRVLDNVIYVFDNEGGKLLTVYPVPEEFRPVENFLYTKDKAERDRKLAELGDLSSAFVDGHRHCLVRVEDDNDGTKYYVSPDGLTDDIGLALEFKSKQRAVFYIKNNKKLWRGYRIEFIYL